MMFLATKGNEKSTGQRDNAAEWSLGWCAVLCVVCGGVCGGAVVYTAVWRNITVCMGQSKLSFKGRGNDLYRLYP